MRGLDLQLSLLAENSAKTLPVFRPSTVLNINKLLRRLVSSTTPDIDALIVIGNLGIGGAEYYAAGLYRSLCRLLGDSVQIIVTDGSSRNSMALFGANSHITFLSDLQTVIEIEFRTKLLRDFISVRRPKYVFNVNSHAFWELMNDFGLALRHFSDIYSCVFCYDPHENGLMLGYAATHFHRSITSHKGYITDNSVFPRQLAADIGLPPEQLKKFHVLYAPIIDPPNSVLGTRATTKLSRRRPVIMWASRLAFQKRPDFAVDVASLCPEFDFHFYGESSAWWERVKPQDIPKNVSFLGAFPSAASLPYGTATAFLYTSTTDGLPNSLVSVAAAKLPIVAMLSGGIPDLVDDTTGWGVSNTASPSEVASVVRACIQDPVRASERAKNMYFRVQSTHNFDFHLTRLRDVLEV